MTTDQEVQVYIERALSKNHLRLDEGERPWRKYIVNIMELVWARNFVDGYQIHLYSENETGYRFHHGTATIDDQSWERINKSIYSS